MCYDNIVKGIIDDDVDRVVELLERNTNEIKHIMTNFKLYFLFYKTKSKEMVIALLDYFDVKNMYDITLILTSIINIAIMHGMDIKMIKRLIDRGGSINNTDVRNVSPLLQCIKSKRNINFVKEILKMGADVNEKCGRYRDTILDIAISNFYNGDDIEIIKLLIDSGADINAAGSHNPLMKLSLNADENLWLELIKKRLYIDEDNAKYSVRDTFLTTVLAKKRRIDQFIDLLIYNRFSVDALNKVCNRLLYLALKNNCSVDYIIEIIDKGANVNEMKYLNKYDNDYSTTPLLLGLQLKRDKEIIFALLNSRADVNAIDEHGVTPLLCAISNNYKVEVINKLISLGADINKCNFDGVTPLMCAIKNKDKEITNRLINAEADVNAMDMFGRMSLCYAVVYFNDHNVISSLIKKGANFSEINDCHDRFWFSIEVVEESDDKFFAELIPNRNDVNIKDEFGQTFLMYALELSMNKNIIFNIIRNGVDINATDNRGYTPLIYAIKYECDIEVINKLIKHGADVNVSDNDGLTPLKHAVHSSTFKEIIQILLDNGVNINTHDENNNTVLLYILKHFNNNKELVSFVIQKGADVNICDNKGLTPLMYTVLYCMATIKTEIVAMLIESGAYIDAVDVDGHTALYYAFSCEDYSNDKTLTLLLDYGASVRKSVEYLGEGETPLNNALHHERDVKILIELLNCKEDINGVCKSGSSFLFGVYAFHKELSLLLISDHNYILKNDTLLFQTIFSNASDIYIKKVLFCCGLDVNISNNDFRTPLSYIVGGNRSVVLIKEILENGGNVKLADRELNTPLHYCTSAEVINLLIVYGIADITARNNHNEITCCKTLDRCVYHFQKTVKLFIKHLLLVSPEEIIVYDSVETYYLGFIKGCIVELKKMASTNIVNNLSFFKFCCKLSKREMNLISESDNFCVFSDEQIKKLFPIYFDIIVMKIKKCKIDLSKRQLINALEKLIIKNRVSKSYDRKKCKADLNNCCIVKHSDQFCECVFLNYDIIYCISNYLCDRHIVNLLLASLYVTSVHTRNLNMCYDNIVKGIIDDDVDSVVELLERNTNEIKHIMTNFKLYFLFYKTKSKEMVIALLDYFDVKNMYDITLILTSIINIAIMHGMDIKMIKRLIDRGGSINNTDVRNVSPLLQCIKSKRNINFVKEILKMGADVNEKCGIYRDTILDIAISNFYNGDDIEIIKLLIDSGADINAAGSHNPLMKLSLNADENLWLELIKKRLFIDEDDAKYSVRDTFLTTVLAKKRRIDQFIDLLIYNRFSVDALNKVCNRLLYLALKNNCSVDYIIEIIDKGANVNEMKYLNKYDNDYSTTPLLLALQLKRDKEIIFALLNSRADVNAIDEHGVTPLLCAISNNYKVEVISKLISLGADINKCNFDGVTPLMCAIKNKDKEITNRLINAEADVNAMDMFGRTSLYYAVVYFNDHNVINLLIKKGANFSKINDCHDRFWFSIEVVEESGDKFFAELIPNRNDVNIKDEFGQTFLMYALELSMNKNIIFNIIRNGADINATDNRGYTPLIYAIKYECDIEVINKLIKHGADVNVIDNDGLTPLKHAVHSSTFKEIIQILLDNGVNINTHDENNNTVLLYLLKHFNNNKELVSFVIQKGADVNICDNKGLTPLMYTVLYCVTTIKTEIVAMLIESGAYIDAVDVDGHTALYYAFSCEDYSNDKTLTLLLDYGASVRKSVEYLGEGETPLNNALRHDRDVKILIELLNCKEDINEVCKSGSSFLFGVYAFHKELSLLLISDHNYILKNDTLLFQTIFSNASDVYIKRVLFCCGLDVNISNNDFRTPLSYIVGGNRSVVFIKEILENGGNVKLADRELNTPLHYCTSPEVINLLIVYGNADITARNNHNEITCCKTLDRCAYHFRKTVKLFLKHLLLVSPEEIIVYDSVETYYLGFIRGCKVELKKMLSTNIVNNLSFFKFCCKLSKREMNLISESDNFCVYSDEQIKELFPIYFDIIVMKIKKCKIDLSKRQLINALEKLIIKNRVSKSYDRKKCKADLNNCCIFKHSGQFCECVFLNYDIIYCISNYLCDRHIVNLLLASL
ncbi:uncharacterized protein LOC142334028 [Lycorma delicatula]|uniref:uncharacterized protein LOC142334028 n=1 Tax=Lycorma delicatula TaxID=130591 RepID=UPI003F51A1F5